MADRIYLPNLAEGEECLLSESEAHHLTRVLRTRLGTEIEVFDGNGRAAAAELVQVSRRSVTVRVGSIRSTQREQNAKIVLATAVPKGDRFRWLIEKATELGVSRLIPVQAARSVVEPRDGKLDKLRQTVVSACKQSGRNQLMTISSPISWSDLVETHFPTRCVFVGDRTGEPFSQVSIKESAGEEFWFAVGPEGGFTEAELHLAQAAGARIVGLGQTVLRVETAAVAFAAWAALAVNAFGPNTPGN